MLCPDLPAECEICQCVIHKNHLCVKLTVLIIDCWQREYNKRPYSNFKISRTFFEERMKRSFSAEDWPVIIDFIGKRQLETISICYISMSSLEDGISMENLVKHLLKASSVHLRNVELPVAFLMEFYKNIDSCKIKDLDLNENNLTYNHLILLRGILIQSHILTILSVKNCNINDNTFPVIADGIYKSKSIRCVDISCPIPISTVSIFESTKFISTVAQMIWQNKLTELHLRHCNLNGHDMEPFSEYLYRNDSKLLHLDLQSNNIASHGTEYLFKALAKSNTLQILNLSRNNIGSKGGTVIARYISSTNLHSLDITHNQIDSEAVHNLLSALKKPRDLKCLKMYGNQCSAKSAIVLRRLLRARVIAQNDIDLACTWDHSKQELCVVPFSECDYSQKCETFTCTY